MLGLIKELFVNEIAITLGAILLLAILFALIGIAIEDKLMFVTAVFIAVCMAGDAIIFAMGYLLKRAILKMVRG